MTGDVGRLRECADRIALQIEAVERMWEWRERANHMEGFTVYDMQASDGHLILAPLLAAQAQVLAALAAMDSTP